MPRPSFGVNYAKWRLNELVAKYYILLDWNAKQVYLFIPPPFVTLFVIVVCAFIFVPSSLLLNPFPQLWPAGGGAAVTPFLCGIANSVDFYAA